MVDCEMKASKFDYNNVKIVQQHLAELNTDIFRYREVYGDGNGFFRATIFSYLENIILTNNTFLIKKIITDIEEKFDPDYGRHKIINSEIKKLIGSYNKTVILDILMIIYELMTNSKKITLELTDEQSLNSAYIVFLYSFIFSEEEKTDMVN